MIHLVIRKAEARRNQVLNLMKRHGYISDEECEIAKSISVTSLLDENSNIDKENQGMIDTIVAEVIRRTGKSRIGSYEDLLYFC